MTNHEISVIVELVKYRYIRVLLMVDGVKTSYKDFVESKQREGNLLIVDIDKMLDNTYVGDRVSLMDNLSKKLLEYLNIMEEQDEDEFYNKIAIQGVRELCVVMSMYADDLRVVYDTYGDVPEYESLNLDIEIY